MRGTLASRLAQRAKPGRCRMGDRSLGRPSGAPLSSGTPSSEFVETRVTRKQKNVCFVCRGAPLSLGRLLRCAGPAVSPVLWPPRGSWPARPPLPFAAAAAGLAPPAVSPIVQTVERRLRESSYYYLRSIRCAFEAGVITLRGRVPTFYLKQTVQAIVEKIEGVEQVVNLVEVFDSRQAPLPSIRQPADRQLESGPESRARVGTRLRTQCLSGLRIDVASSLSTTLRRRVQRRKGSAPRYFFGAFRWLSSQAYIAALAFSASAP